jgi:hypothetical protein
MILRWFLLDDIEACTGQHFGKLNRPDSTFFGPSLEGVFFIHKLGNLLAPKYF